jgi:hypothetical protein
MAISIQQAQTQLLSERAQINAVKMVYVRLQNFEKATYYREKEKAIEIKIEQLKVNYN